MKKFSRPSAQPGDWNLDFTFYTVEERNVGGAIVREPVFAYKLFGRRDPTEAFELRADLTEIAETWAAFSLPYMPEAIPVASMLVEVGGEAGRWEVRGVKQYETVRVELVCRLVV